jgi:hypothetical protein
VCQSLDDLPAGAAAPPDRTKPWGTGHAIWTARRAIGAPFGVINADDFYGRTSYRVLSEFLGSAAPAGGVATYAMVGFRLRNTLSLHGTVARGVCRADADGYLCEVVERTKIAGNPDGSGRFQDDTGAWQTLDGDTVVSMNLWGFTPAVFPQLEAELTTFLAVRGRDPKAEFFIPTVVDTMIRRGHVRTRVLTTPEKWCGMTYREDRDDVAAAVRALIDRGIYPRVLWQD